MKIHIISWIFIFYFFKCDLFKYIEILMSHLTFLSIKCGREFSFTSFQSNFTVVLYCSCYPCNLLEYWEKEFMFQDFHNFPLFFPIVPEAPVLLSASATLMHSKKLYKTAMQSRHTQLGNCRVKVKRGHEEKTSIFTTFSHKVILLK